MPGGSRSAVVRPHLRSGVAGSAVTAPARLDRGALSGERGAESTAEQALGQQRKTRRRG